MTTDPTRESRKRLVYEVARRRARGESIRAIARALRIDRKTVRRIERDLATRRHQGDDATGAPPRPARAPRASKLDGFVKNIETLLLEYPDIRATRVHEELRARGFDGGYTIVRDYLKKLRPKKSKRPSVWVQTDTGEQVQMDWSPYKIADGSRVYAFSCVLSYSRYQVLTFCTDMRQPTLFRQLKHAFETFGGVPAEVVTDSMPGVVDRWELDQPILNLRAVNFAAYYGFGWHIAPRADGAYKGKVERPFRYVEESLFNGRTFANIDQLRSTNDWWLERANTRLHTTLKARPIDRLELERASLRPLPTVPFDDRDLAFRQVDGYGYVPFDGNHYRAPLQSVGTWVYVRANDSQVGIYDMAALPIASHPRGLRGQNLRIPQPAAHKPLRRAIAQLVLRFDSLGPTALAFAERIRQKRRRPGVHLAATLELLTRYTAEDLLAAIEHAHKHGAHDHMSVQRILEVRAKPRTFADHIAQKAKQRILASMAHTPVHQRDLGAYAHLPLGPQRPDDPDAHDEDSDVQTNHSARSTTGDDSRGSA